MPNKRASMFTRLYNWSAVVKYIIYTHIDRCDICTYISEKNPINPNRIESTVCLRDWGQQLTMRRQQSCKLQVAHECILISYGCRALHTHAHTLHRESGEHTAKSSSRVDKVRTSTKLQLISDALRRQHTGRTYYRAEVHTHAHTHTHGLTYV